MLDKKNAREILLTALSRGGDFAEIFIESSKTTSISLDDGNIEKLITGTDRGVGIRIVDGERTYFANTNHIDTQSMLSMAEKLAQGLGKSRKIKAIQFKKRQLPTFSQVRIPPEKVEIEKKIEILHQIDRAARDYDPRIVQVTGIYQDETQEVLIANSEGIFDNDLRTYPLVLIRATAKEGEMVQTGLGKISGTQGLELFDEHSPEEIGRESARSAIFQLEAEPAPAGTYTVVILAEAGGGVLIHEAVGHGLEADSTAKGCSVYAGKIGQKVASELITVVDDRTLPNYRGTAKIDDEGYPCQRTVLIQNGILVGYLQDRKFAKQTKSSQTGHGRRESFRYLPLPRMGNTLVVPGKTPPREIINSLKEGILVQKLGGVGQVEPVSGSFVFSVAEAYLVKNGEMIPVKGATLVGNGPKILEEIDLVGSDFDFDGGTCGKGQWVPVGDGQPSLRIPRIVIGGLVREGKDE